MGWADYYIKELKAGNTVSFRPKGNSMVPRIRSGQLVTVKPVQAPVETAQGTIEGQEPIEVGDVVLCKVGGSQYLHLVTARKHLGNGNMQFQISSNRGRVNGWVGYKDIYGILIRVS